MEICCEAPVPTCRSPKSIDEGVVTTGSAFADENIREFALQPASAMVARQARAAIALAPELSVDEWTCERTAAFSVNLKKVVLRNLIIRYHLHRAIYLLRSADAENPAEPAAGGISLGCIV